MWSYVCNSIVVFSLPSSLPCTFGCLDCSGNPFRMVPSQVWRAQLDRNSLASPCQVHRIARNVRIIRLLLSVHFDARRVSMLPFWAAEVCAAIIWPYFNGDYLNLRVLMVLQVIRTSTTYTQATPSLVRCSCRNPCWVQMILSPHMITLCGLAVTIQGWYQTCKFTIRKHCPGLLSDAVAAHSASRGVSGDSLWSVRWKHRDHVRPWSTLFDLWLGFGIGLGLVWGRYRIDLRFPGFWSR